MKIYGDVRSGNCDKIRFVADDLGLAYQWIEVDSVGGETRTPGFLAKNPQGQVPFIELSDGRCLAQSNAIVRFLAYGTALMPEEPFIRARIDEWMFWEANNHEFFVAGCIGHMTYKGLSKATRDLVCVTRGERALDVMNAHLASRDWFVGDEMTAADIVLFAYTRNAHLGGFDMHVRPQLMTWISTMASRLKLPMI